MSVEKRTNGDATFAAALAAERETVEAQALRCGISKRQLNALTELLRSINAETSNEAEATALIGRWGVCLSAAARTLSEEA